MDLASVLIAGNMGYAGPGVVRQLRASYPDARIVGLDVGFFAHCLTGSGLLPETALDAQYFGDIRDPLPLALQGVEAVVNLAAVSNDPMGSAFAEATEQINHHGAVALAQAAKAAGARTFVFASSCSVYGFSEGGPRKETDPTHPLTPYARSKLAAEQSLAALADSEFTVTSLRFPTLCGASDRLRLDLVLNDLVADAVANRRVRIFSDGSPWRPLMDTADMALAVDWAVQRRPEQGGVALAVNVGSDDCNYRIRDLASAVAAELQDVDISINPDATPDKRSYRLNCDLYQELAPAYLPRVDLRTSIRSLIRQLDDLGFADPEFRNSEFIRLRVLAGMESAGLVDRYLRRLSRSETPATVR